MVIAEHKASGHRQQTGFADAIFNEATKQMVVPAARRAAADRRVPNGLISESGQFQRAIGVIIATSSRCAARGVMR